MKNLVLASLILVGLNSKAITLGEYVGSGSNSVTIRLEGEVREYANPCTAAMNIRSDSERFALDYSLFQCGGMDVWNDNPAAFEISGNQLIRDGVVAGSADLDQGIYEFTTSETVKKVVRQTNYNDSCEMINQKDLQFDLRQTFRYRFVKIPTSGYRVFRYSSVDAVEQVMKKYAPNCSARPFFVKTNTTKNLGVEVFNK